MPNQIERFGYTWDPIQGFGEFFDFHDYYQAVVTSTPPGSTIVEVGNYCGRSLICLGFLAREANKGLQVVGVDNDAMHGNFRLRENIKAAGLSSHIRLIAMDSPEAANLFSDQSCWLVFIDGGHVHEQVEIDVKAWMPKIKPDGWLAGHDFRMHTVYQPLIAMFPGRIIYDERWIDIWTLSKCEPLQGVNIYEVPKDYLPKFSTVPFA